MRTRYLIAADMIEQLGGPEKVGSLLGVEEGTVRKYAEDPERSGRDIPVNKLLRLISLAAAQETNEALQNILDELLAHFAAPAKRKIVRDCALLEVEEALFHLKNGKSYDSVIQRCDKCSGPLKIKGKMDGLFLYECPRCHGTGHEAVA